MIRIIKALRAHSFDKGDGEWHSLPMVPATGTLELSERDEAAGRLATAKINATLSRDMDVVRDNLMLEVHFCDGEGTLVLGSRDLPLRFEVNRTDTLKLSCAYSYPLF